MSLLTFKGLADNVLSDYLWAQARRALLVSARSRGRRSATTLQSAYAHASLICFQQQSGCSFCFSHLVVACGCL
eukprot:2250223-Pleurochrysis_carterae.AAC.1